MPIIKFSKIGAVPEDVMLYRGPDQLVSEAEKQSDDWMKQNMDFYWTIAVSQYSKNRKKLVRNYELVKGILKNYDFYEEELEDNIELKSFTEVLLQQEKLPSYVKHYSILTPPINTMVGEMSKRPDNVYVKDFSDLGQSEELQYKTDILNQYIIDNARIRIQAMMAQKGIEIDAPDEIERMTAERVEDELMNYNSTAERWGSNMLEYLKVRLNLKEKSEDAFRDMLISARQFFHVYEDASDIGFNVEVLNPVNTWFQTTPNQKYTSDPLNKNVGAFAAGTIDVMELSEVLQKFPFLTEEEIKHLRDYSQRDFLLTPTESNLVNPIMGEKGIQYDTYDPLLYEARIQAEAALTDPDYGNFDILGTGNNVGTYGYKYTVLRAYWCSKKKVGKLTYIDIDGVTQVELVDENYKEGSHPQEIDIEWNWINQWYQGIKIGHDVYYVKPFELFDYCPIIGCIFENKNAKAASLVDQMKPYQILYNVSMNQLFRLLEKDMGVVFLTSLRHIPVAKDGEYQDAVEIWEAEAREKGIVFIDDSPENTRVPSSFNNYTALNLSRANEIQIRYQLATELRNECWKLVGLTEQRLGSVTATETATGTNAALSASYAQTEPWFSQHGYNINKVYQAVLDAAQYIESHKPLSTVNYISTEGTHAFIQISGSDLNLKNLGVLVTNRQEDGDNLRQLKMLSQAMLQNGAHPYEISVIQNSKSARFIQETFKKLKTKQEELQQQMQDLETAKLEQAEQQFARQQELLQLQLEKQQAFEGFQKEQDRLSKEKIAYIQASTTNAGAMNTSQFDREEAKLVNDYNIQLQTLSQKQQELLSREGLDQRKLQLEDKKIEMEKYKIDKQKEIEQIKLRNKVSGEK